MGEVEGAIQRINDPIEVISPQLIGSFFCNKSGTLYQIFKLIDN